MAQEELGQARSECLTATQETNRALEERDAIATEVAEANREILRLRGKLAEQVGLVSCRLTAARHPSFDWTLSLDKSLSVPLNTCTTAVLCRATKFAAWSQ